MMILNGVANLQWLLLLTMVAVLAIAPVFGWLTSLPGWAISTPD
jgi:hypothetical protein